MKETILLAGFIAVSLKASAQQTFAVEAEPEVRITSPLADGQPTKPIQPPSPPEFKINWETKVNQGGRQVKMREVEAPVFPKPTSIDQVPVVELSSEEISALLNQRGDASLLHFLTVSATIYDDTVTQLQIWNYEEGEQNSIEAWSNVNWSHLGGFSSFEGRGKEFTFLMAHGNFSLEKIRAAKKKNPKIEVPQVPEQLPTLAAHGPRYVVTNEKEGSKTVLDFLESIHDLYAAEKETLVQAHDERKRQNKIRAEELLTNPPKPEDIEISFWNNNINKK